MKKIRECLHVISRGLRCPVLTVVKGVDYLTHEYIKVQNFKGVKIKNYVIYLLHKHTHTHIGYICFRETLKVIKNSRTSLRLWFLKLLVARPSIPILEEVKSTMSRPRGWDPVLGHR